MPDTIHVVFIDNFDSFTWNLVDELARTCTGPDIPRVEVLGTPIAFIPHGKPDRILSDLGLDGPGIAATVRSILAS